MYIILNAFKNILRNKGRNILIGSIIFILITVSIISLCINNTTKSIINDYKARFGSEVTIGPDMSKIMSSGNLKGEKPTIMAPPAITPQQYIDFANSEYLKEYKLTASASAGGDEIKAIDEDSNPGVGGVIIGGDGLKGDEFISPKLHLWANSWEDFDKGFRKLSEGKMPEKEGECIISTDLAELNNFKVGDQVTLKSSKISLVGDEQTVETLTVKLTITGIYLDATEPYATQFKIPSMNRRNEILTTFDTIIKNYDKMTMITAKYYLKNPSMLEDYEAELRAKGLDEYYKVSVDEAGYQKVVGPVEGLKKISLTFMIIVLAFGSVVLVLLSSIAIRERKYEIGVLRAMGMKKRKVAFGLWSEMLIITACCLVFGFISGTAVAQPVSDVLLSEQIENAKEAEQNTGGFQGAVRVISGRGVEEKVPLDKVDVSVGIDTILEIAGIALLLATIASAVSISKITKYEPIKILMERN